MKSETALDKLLDHVAFHYPGVPLDAAERELFTLRAREQALVAALKKIKTKSEMWQAAGQSTAATHAIPPWWNLGDIAAAALKKHNAALAAGGEQAEEEAK